MQPHFRKCFEGIRSVVFVDDATDKSILTHLALTSGAGTLQQSAPVLPTHTPCALTALRVECRALALVLMFVVLSWLLLVRVSVWQEDRRDRVS